ncbi:MAG: S-adenosylmethionine:tRNA ribosyltransferase-isomerase [Acidimicrobiia bacterium]
MIATSVEPARLSFELPAVLEAGEPPEVRGATRDAVRLLVAHRGDGSLDHSTFGDLPRHLEPGDLVVINTSATIAAALGAVGRDGQAVIVHLSTELDDHRWVVEVRRPEGNASARWSGPGPGRRLALHGGGSVVLRSPYRGSDRLWVADIEVDGPVLRHLAAHGRPIRYGYVTRPWPLHVYQNVYATEPGSAEMPSAGRPFTAELLTRLVAEGVGITPVVLHTGVASLEGDEVPYPERFRVPPETAARVNATRAAGGRVVAVGTTVVRALESSADDGGRLVPADGWTDLVITPQRGVRTVDGLVTGWHEPEASHLLMLEAIAGRELLESSYRAGLAEGYRWHEFGDAHLVLP